MRFSLAIVIATDDYLGLEASSDDIDIKGTQLCDLGPDGGLAEQLLGGRAQVRVRLQHLRNHLFELAGVARGDGRVQG